MPSDARQTFQALAAKNPVGYLLEAAALREAECDEALNDQDAAMQVYERLSKTKSTAPDDVLMRFGRAAKAAGHPDKATEAYSRVVYEFPFSDLAPIAGGELESLPIAPIAPGSNRFKLELGRAERLFGARRYAQARPVFEGLRATARDDDREVVQLRIAECDYFLKRTRNARDGVRPFIDTGARQGEALYFYAVATRELGGHDEYLRLVRRIVDRISEPELGRRSAEQPRHALHPPERRRQRGEDLPGDVREVPDRALRRARRVEDRLVGVPERELRRDRARVRGRRRELPAIGLSSAVAVLVGARARGAARAGARRLALRAGRNRLSQQLLRPPGVEAARHLAPASASPPTRSRIRRRRRRTPPTICRRRRRCRRTRRSCARCSGSSSTIRRSTSCTTRRRCGAIRSAIQATIGWIYYPARRAAHRHQRR